MPARALGFIAVGSLIVACSSEESSSPAQTGDAGADATAGCGAGSAAALRECVDRAALESDLQFIAKPREPGSAHWQAVQDLCKSRLEQYGFAVNLQDYGSGINVVGIKQGSDQVAQEVLISAHYDHIPGCAGADDNASGVAALLETARVLKDSSFSRTLVIACWDEEELGLVGAKAYAAQAKAAGADITVMYSLEMLGFKSTAPGSQQVPTGINLLFPDQYADLEQSGFVGDFLTIIPDSSAAAAGARVAAHAAEIGLRTVTLEITDALKTNALAADVRRSDHAAFWDQDFPAMMLTDTSEFRNPNYHCRDGREDTTDTLDMQFLTDNTRAVVGSAVDLLELR